MKHLIVGYGQIGMAIGKVLSRKYKVSHVDRGQHIVFPTGEKIVLHVCFPYTNKFVEQVYNYIREYGPVLIIIHSTVDIGTTEKIGIRAVHSPVRGIHPHLKKGILTFTKYFGGECATKAAKIFKDLGIKTKCYKDAKITEAGKMMSTTYYGWNLMFEKWLYEYCNKHKIDFKAVYKHFGESYNDGYDELNMPHVKRPLYKHMAGPLGGHCIIPNCKILKDFKPAKIILKKNKKL